MSYFLNFLTALRFLTIVPVSFRADRDISHLRQSVKYFPLIGMLIGVAAVALMTVLRDALPPLILSCVALLFLGAISGFLHLDGLADTADGFFSARPKEKILSIMHDSRTGAMGVISLILILLFKASALNTLGNSDMMVALFFMPFAGRCAIVLSMSFFPYAREEGLGKLFYGENTTSLTLTSITVFIILGSLVSFKLTLITLITTLMMVVCFGLWCKKMIGGSTGDTLGATCELTETLVAIVLASLLTP